MATPVSNAVGLTGDSRIDGLVQGSKWQFSTANPIITYSLSNNDTANGSWNFSLSDAVRRAFAEWSNVANVAFIETGSGTVFTASTADIAVTPVGAELGDDVGGIGIFPSAAASDILLSETGYTRATYPRPEGDIFLNDALLAGFMSPGNAGFQVILHEIGHALGLKHTYDDGLNSRPTYDSLGLSAVDDERYSIMADAPFDGATEYARTPMLYDILAIQAIYGANMTYHTGDDTYSIDGTMKALWDAGGTDTLSAQFMSAGVLIDLRPGAVMTFSNGGLLGIAYGTTIENAIGTSAADHLIGNAAGNRLDGNGGADILEGLGGDDTYIVQSGTPEIIERAGEGTDTVLSKIDYTLGANVENLTLEAPASFGGVYAINGTGNDSANVIIGNAAANTLRGLGGDDVIDGGAGIDTMIGGAGNDTYIVTDADGSNGPTVLTMTGAPGAYITQGTQVYSPATGNFQITLGDRTNDGVVDALSLWYTEPNFTHWWSFEVSTFQLGVNLLPGVYKDAQRAAFVQPGHPGLDLSGDGRGSNQVFGTFVVNFIQVDYSGSSPRLLSFSADYEHHSESPGAPPVTGTFRYNFGNGSIVPEPVIELADEGIDTVRASIDYALPDNVENLVLTGSANLNGTGNAAGNDITGNSGDNVLEGRSGNDTLRGGAGNDRYIVEDAGDVVIELSDQGIDTVSTWVTYTLTPFVENLVMFSGPAIDGTGNDRPNLMIGNEQANRLDGATGDDTLSGKDGDDTLIGGAGNDTLDGGVGEDVAVYTQARSAYAITHNGTSTVVRGPDGTDTLANVEFLQFADRRIAADQTEVRLVRDFDFDGRSDMLWRDAATGAVSVWQMNGTQVGATAAIDSVSSAWTAVDTYGDYNGDGRTDVLWRNVNDGSVALWQMNGTRKESGVVFANALPPSTRLVDSHGDYNGDGKSDILWRSADGAVSMWLMNGTQTPSSVAVDTIGANWSLVDAHADYNGDGRSDILWRLTEAPLLQVWLMNGTVLASFDAVAGLDENWSIVDAQGDYNGDGRSDILWRNKLTGAVQVFQMNGASREAAATVDTVGLDWRIIDGHSDYNGDGRSDIAWRNNADGLVAVWLMNGTQKLGGAAFTDLIKPQRQFLGGPDGGADIAGGGAADVLRGTVRSDRISGEAGNDVLNGAAGNDILIGGAGVDVARFAGSTSSYVTSGTGSGVIVRGIDGDDSVSTVEWLQFDDAVRRVDGPAQTDFGWDFKSDILWRNSASGTVSTWQMNGTQIGATSTIDTVAADWRIVDTYGDYNRDGRSDVLWRNVSDGTVALWQMNGAQKETGAVFVNNVLPLGSRIVEAHADYDGDGRSEVLWRGSDGTVSIWQMNGTQAPTTAVVDSVSADWSIVAANADFNGDGKGDILWRNVNDGMLAMWQMDGTRKAGGASFDVVSWEWSIVDAQADFNGDGRSDILWRNSADGMVVLWQMNGALKDAGVAFEPMAASWRILDVHGDYNGDGRSDILWRNSADGAVQIWQMKGTVREAIVTIDTVAPSWRVIDGHGDYDGDGRSDIAWRNDDDGMVALWLMDGTQKAGGAAFADDVLSPQWQMLGASESGAALFGDAASNVLRGTVNDDYLAGRQAEDTLFGGAGNDRFLFDTAPAAGNDDTIVDFERGADKLLLSDVIFTRLQAGALAPASFVSGPGAVAQDTDDFVLYDTTTGRLSYDADGNGAGAAVLVATLLGSPLLTAADIHVGLIA
ncbi:MAG TPA: FG-GAP-like repeat-containing protein [Burkholderiales bacterium]|nr:FG-GAP-like repeat-containing protein [Burkholderiales bacterium]